ncbi:hypothetical protein J7643_16920 [bacterium]|nr:hypothetical protein [bacterium]
MQNSWMTRALTLGLTAGILTAPTLAMAATKTMNGPTSKIPETRDGIKGNTHEYIEYTYQSIADRIAGMPGASELSPADLQALADRFKGQNPTDAQLQAAINDILYQKAIAALSGRLDAVWNAMGGGGWGVSKAAVLEFLKSNPNATDQQIRNVITTMRDWTYGGNSVSRYSWPTSYSHSFLAQDLAPKLAAALGIATNQAAYNAAYSVFNNRGFNYNDPLVLDLNGNGKIDVTGLSSAKHRAKQNMAFVAQGAVKFDIRGTGTPILTEWVGKGDGLLIDNRKNKALDLVKQGKNFTIANLFGDDGGHLSGFNKLAKEFNPDAKLASANGPFGMRNAGLISGAELADMLVWIDDGDGVAKEKELFTLQSLGITELKLPARYVANADGEYLEQATFTRNGKQALIQEVWFAGDDQK